jgi:MYXO-CTERM domain-containing protein
MRTLSVMALSSLFAATAVAGDPNPGQDSGLSESETSYKGAWMLEGGIDVDFGGVTVGSLSNDDAQTTYAFFTGNTLYVGAEDADGNGVDAIVEFFWFESSLDRGSDFYVAVIKTKNSPNRTDDYVLETGDADPVLFVDAYTNTAAGNGSFRWDWSSPFESYGMDSYGEVTLETEYGLGVDAEGTATYAQKVNQDGARAEIDLQTKGFVDSDFRVKTQYQVTLWRWEVEVDGAPHNVRWDMTLHNSDREEENAYHEFFLVMQADEGQAMTIDRLDIGGTVDIPWSWSTRELSVALEDIVLTRPFVESGISDDEDPVDPDPVDEDTDTDPIRPGGGDRPVDEVDTTPGACSTAPAASFGLGWLALGAAALIRRRR